ncbi:MAG: signal peptidase II [Pirellulales bacterium]|nr:signal peptidase II [Pirellulales bacterium]
MKAVPQSRYWVFFSLAILGCSADLATKSGVFQWLGMPGGPTWWLWDGVIGCQTSLNEGALFGMGQGMVVVFAALSVVAALAILWWLFVAGAASDLLLTIALGSITAGILGNLYDRLGFPSLQWNFANALHDKGDPVFAVRDWILVMIGNWPWPNFNIADSMLVCGAGLLLWHAFHSEQAPEQPQVPRELPANASQDQPVTR